MKTVTVVTPMYNESAVMDDFFAALSEADAAVRKAFPEVSLNIVCVNDGSRDDTLQKLTEQHAKTENLTVVNLSRNFGQEPAVFAGLSEAKGDAVIVMDCDLQDPPSLIPEMIDKWLEGYDVINCKRVSRVSDTTFKKNTAGLYYRILNKLSYKVKFPGNVNNFRLIDRRVLDVVLAMPETQKFYRGLVPYAGFKTCEIEFARKPRLKGESKYSLRAMSRLAIEGITATSVKPLFWALPAGLILLALGLGGGLATLILWLCGLLFNETLFGVLSGLFFVTGIILTSTGIQSIYLAKIFEEIKGKPFYIKESVLKQTKK